MPRSLGSVVKIKLKRKSPKYLKSKHNCELKVFREQWVTVISDKQMLRRVGLSVEDIGIHFFLALRMATGRQGRKHGVGTVAENSL